MTLTTQFLTILSMIAGGVYLGTAIGTFRRFEPYWKKRTLFSYLLEISFWLLQTLILFYILYLVNQGELRFYILLALLCGYAMYKSLFESIYERVLERIIFIIVSLYRFFYRLVQMVIVQPIKWMIQLCLSILLSLWGVIVWVLIMAFKIVWYPIKFIIGLIWRLVPQNAKNYLTQTAGFYSKIKNRVIKWWQIIKNKRG